MVEAQLENFLGGDDAVTTRNPRRQAVEHGGLPGLGATSHDNIESSDNGCFQELGCLLGETSQVDQVAQLRRTHDKLPDVHGTETPRDAFEHDVEPVAVGERCVDEGQGQIDPAAAGLEHPLHELLHLRRIEDRAGQLVPAAASNEDPAGIVDPDLLHRWVVEVALKRPETGNPGNELIDDDLGVTHR